MFGLISYIFKIIISLGTGYIIGYSNDSEEKNNFQFFTSLTSFIFASLTGVIYLMDSSLIFIGLLFLSVLYLLSDNLSDDSLLDKYKILFSAINGVIIGFGFVLYSIIITLLFSYIANNYDIISDLLSSKNKNIDKEKNELDLNDEGM
tara:strand:+ start:410 stop:853 length:444 start_codon:yes stop_codon:yes gene_type:complete